MGHRATSWREIPSGTWLVLILTTSFVIIGLGNVISQWNRVTSDLSFALAALAGLALPLAALAWGVHLAKKAVSQ